MISEGQEFARSKVILDDVTVADSEKGMIDHNSYNKDNETNYVNYELTKLNKELVDYYKGLISLRNNYAAFRRAGYEDVTFYDIKDNHFALGYHLKFDNDELIILFNAQWRSDEEFHLPKGDWEVLVSPEKAGTESQGTVNTEIEVPPSTGYVLKKK